MQGYDRFQGQDAQSIPGVGRGVLGAEMAAKQAAEPRALEMLNKRLVMTHAQIVEACVRLETALDRLYPMPKNVSDQAAPKPVANGLHMVEMTTNDLENTSRWLHDIATRLDRIA